MGKYFTKQSYVNPTTKKVHSILIMINQSELYGLKMSREPGKMKIYVMWRLCGESVGIFKIFK